MNEASFSEKKPAYPLRFAPVYKDYLWGGDRIIRRFRRSAPPGIYAESWEVSTRPEGPGVVANGPLAGTPLAALFPDFPLLIKLIDARQKLSVQVHPNDEAAARFGGEAKTEMWYVLAADPGACVYCGLQPGTDEAALLRALAAKRVGDLLVKIPVAAGDAIYVPGGRVHAIGEGCLLFECQQNSNTTYRLYDWDRTGADGKPRELHIEQSLRVINWHDTAPVKLSARTVGDQAGVRRCRLLDTSFFRVERLEITGPLDLPREANRHEILFVAEGSLRIRSAEFDEEAAAGTTYLLSPAVKDAVLVPTPSASVLRVTA